MPPCPHCGCPGHPEFNGTTDARAVLAFLNERLGTRYQPVPANITMIQARLKEGATPARMRAVIAIKVRQWGKDPKMSQFLRPKTLFSRTNYANYEGTLPATAFEEE